MITYVVLSNDHFNVNIRLLRFFSDFEGRCIFNTTINKIEIIRSGI